MILDYSEKGKLQVSMIPYLINILKDLTEELESPSATPSSDNLFKVIPGGESIFLPEKQAQVFHHTVV